MDMLITLGWIVVGLIVLIKGADWLVSGASALAYRYHISNLAVGLTIVAFGTSAPELIVNIFASIRGYQDMAFGNILGSNIFNLFLILGVAGIVRPLIVQSSTVWKEIPISLFAALILLLLANLGSAGKGPGLSRLDGVLLLGLFGLFLYYVYTQLQRDSASPETSQTQLAPGAMWFRIGLGLIGLFVGGELLVRNAVDLARLLDVSEKIIGLTIVAAGTSMPELATSVVAAMRKNNDIAVGNIIGSNIFNLLMILGVSALSHPLSYNPQFNFEIAILGLGTVFLFVAMFTGQKLKLDRWEAAILLFGYLAYTAILIRGSLS